jgi:dihydroneopterin aldolase
MPKICLTDLEVLYHVGVPDAERATAQRLLITVEMECDFRAAAAGDRLDQTIDYYAVAQRLLRFGEGRSWKLLERLATEICDLVLAEFNAASVNVTVKKFIIPQARHVSVQLAKRRAPVA